MSEKLGQPPMGEWQKAYMEWVKKLAQRYDREMIVLSPAEFDEIYDQDYLDAMSDENYGAVCTPGVQR